jgi:hypothetical protein
MGPTNDKVPAGPIASQNSLAGEDPRKKPLTPAAERALAEAAARRAERERTAGRRPEEIAGRSGLDPTRYGDWEIKGLASDF